MYSPLSNRILNNFVIYEEISATTIMAVDLNDLDCLVSDIGNEKRDETQALFLLLLINIIIIIMFIIT